ncbi:hypothetical protein KSC_027210 [Ktedonobacter sp. SOSP1-52]|nr:hypothetical protein KSC_027210 [Ktedonobacter sp. SOSP1-52]
MAMQRFVRLDKRMLKKYWPLSTNGPEYHAKRLAWYSGPFVLKGLIQEENEHSQHVNIVVFHWHETPHMLFMARLQQTFRGWSHV